MNIFKENKLYILILLINIMFLFSVVCRCYTITDFDYFYVFAILLVSIFIYYTFTYIVNKVNNKALFLIAFFAITLMCIFYSGVASSLYDELVNNYNILTNEVNSYSVTNFEQFKCFFILIIPILVFFFLTLANRGFTNPILFFLIAVMILFWCLGFEKAIKDNLFRFTFISIITLGINNSINNLKNMKELNVRIHVNPGVICLLVLLPAIIVSVVTTKLPQNVKGKYNENISDRFINNYSKDKNYNMQDRAYGLESSGYDSNHEKLGGPISINDDLVLSIKAERPEYLRGTVKDNYNGFIWSKSYDRYSEMANWQGNVANSKISLLNPSYNSKSLVVYPEKSKISTLFTPIYSYKVSLDKGNVSYNDIPTFIGDLSNNKKYSVNYYSRSEIEQFENCSNEVWLKQELNPTELMNYRPFYKDYLQIPSTITQRTRDLLSNITSNSKNHYEQISKIKAYLGKNYTYTTNVSTVPNNEDFVDYFLFTERKGYCVYFATTATMLCRMEGIPARYVEGFKMIDTKGSDGLYKVTNKEAHAWCEVLTDPEKGLWTTLETTPADMTTSVTNTPENKNTETDKTSINTPAQNRAEKDSKNDISAKDKSVKTNKHKSSIVNVIVLILVLVIILIILKIITAILKINKILKEKSIIPLYNYCIKRLSTVGITKPDNFGDLEYAQTIKDSHLKKLFSELVVITYEEFYGKKPVEGIDSIGIYKQIESYIKMKDSKVGYFIKKYLYL